jgi:hypothetical protein
MSIEVWVPINGRMKWMELDEYEKQVTLEILPWKLPRMRIKEPGLLKRLFGRKKAIDVV